MSENKYPDYALGEIKYGQLWARYSELVDKDSVGKYRITFEGLKKAVEETLSVQPKQTGAGVGGNDAIEFAEWLRSNHYEPTFGNKWVNFSMSGSNRFTTAELHELWQQSKSK